MTLSGVESTSEQRAARPVGRRCPRCLDWDWEEGGGGGSGGQDLTYTVSKKKKSTLEMLKTEVMTTSGVNNILS